MSYEDSILCSIQAFGIHTEAEVAGVFSLKTQVLASPTAVSFPIFYMERHSGRDPLLTAPTGNFVVFFAHHLLDIRAIHGDRDTIRA